MNSLISCDTLGRQVGKTAMKDNTLKKPIYTSDNENYNLKNKLLLEKKIDKDFLDKLQFIKLEELITLKLLVSTKSLRGKLFNFPILKYSYQICREAVFKYALSIAKNRKEASLIVGMKKAEMMQYIREYNLKEEFNYAKRKKQNRRS